MPFIFFISSSALLGGCLASGWEIFLFQHLDQFCSILFLLLELLICLFMKWPVSYLCFFILFGGFLQFLQHLIAYFRNGFSFGIITKETWDSFSIYFSKICILRLSMSVLEISLVIDMNLHHICMMVPFHLIYYANRFLGSRSAFLQLHFPLFYCLIFRE